MFMVKVLDSLPGCWGPQPGFLPRGRPPGPAAVSLAPELRVHFLAPLALAPHCRGPRVSLWLGLRLGAAATRVVTALEPLALLSLMSDDLGPAAPLLIAVSPLN